jgi:hypothetical protein
MSTSTIEELNRAIPPPIALELVLALDAIVEFLLKSSRVLCSYLLNSEF